MRLKTASVMAVLMFGLAMVVLGNTKHMLMNIGPGFSQSEQMKATLAWVSIAGLLALAAKLAIIEARTTNPKQKGASHDD